MNYLLIYIKRYKHLLIISIAGIIVILLSITIWNMRSNPIENLADEFQDAQDFSQQINYLEKPSSNKTIVDSARSNPYFSHQTKNFNVVQIDSSIVESPLQLASSNIGSSIDIDVPARIYTAAFNKNNGEVLETGSISLGMFQEYEVSGIQYWIFYDNSETALYISEANFQNKKRIGVTQDFQFFSPVHSKIINNSLFLYSIVEGSVGNFHAIGVLNLNSDISSFNRFVDYTLLTNLDSELININQNLADGNRIQGIISSTFEGFLNIELDPNSGGVDLYIDEDYFVEFIDEDSVLISTNQQLRRVWLYTISTQELRDLEDLQVSANSHIQVDRELNSFYIIDYGFNFIKWIQIDDFDKIKSGNIQPDVIDQLIVSQYRQTLGTYPNLLYVENNNLYHWNGLEYAPLAVLEEVD